MTAPTQSPDTRATLTVYTCPKCAASTSTVLTDAVVSHRCPMVRGNVMVQWERVS